jgi:hypothetical protein
MDFGRRGTTAAVVTEGLCVGLLVAALAFPQPVAAQDASHVSSANGPLPSYQNAPTRPAPETEPSTAQGAKKANFLREPASDDARQVADWVAASGDNQSLPFVIVDKVNAKVFLFDDHGRLRGASRALLGLARGDDSVAGIGDRKMSSIRPEERITPAGRFVASLGHDTGGQDILWVDYADAVSLHRVITSNPTEHRLQRLATAGSLDKRISYGCINVPAQFYESVVIPAFTGTKGIVYILPETRSIREVFLGLSR